MHLSETCCEPRPDGARAAPNLITAVATTLANMPDVVMTDPVHDLLDAARLLPAEHAVDAGYASADLLIAARARSIALIGPRSPVAQHVPLRVPAGYTRRSQVCRHGA